MSVAYGVRKDYENQGWEPGVIAVGDATVNLAELLKQGDGQIVVDDTANLMIATLDEQLALKRVPVQSAEDKARTSAVKAARSEFSKMTVEDLRKAAERAGVDAPASAVKKDLVAALSAHVESNWKPEEVSA